MTIKTYWRGFIDAQDKTNYEEGGPVVTSEREGILAPLAKLLGEKVHEYRSGYYVPLNKGWEDKLDDTEDKDYARGWFAARGKRYKEPLKLTVSGQPKPFIRLVKKELNLDLPKPQKPSSTSKMERVTITGDKALTLNNWLK